MRCHVGLSMTFLRNVLGRIVPRSASNYSFVIIDFFLLSMIKKRSKLVIFCCMASIKSKLILWIKNLHYFTVTIQLTTSLQCIYMGVYGYRTRYSGYFLDRFAFFSRFFRFLSFLSVVVSFFILFYFLFSRQIKIKNEYSFIVYKLCLYN